MFLANRSLKWKFNHQIGLTILVFCAMLGLTLLSLGAYSQHYDSFSTVGVEVQSRTLMIARDQNFFSRLIRSVMLGDDYEENKALMAKTAEAIRENFKFITAAVGKIADAEERTRLFSQIALAQKDSFDILDDGTATVAKVKGLTDIRALSGEWKIYRANNKDRGDRARLSFSALTGSSKALIDEGRLAPAQDLAKLRMTLILIVLAASVATVIGTVWMRNSIVKPVKDAVRAAERIASGDLTVPVQGGLKNSQDEIAHLLGSLEEMQERLRAVLSLVAIGAETVASGSMELSASADEMSTTTQSISAGTKAQEAGADRMTAAVAQLVASILQVTGHLREAQQQMDQALAATAGGERAELATSDAMAAIKESVTRIVKATQVIDSIAQQTNLLSLNAAIEAAKAGPQGRGFAVVAEEVRKLSAHSAEAAEKVRELAEICQKNVADGASTVGTSVGALRDISRSITGMAVMLKEIGAASEEQAQVSEEVGHQVEGAALATRRTAQATTEQTATVNEVARTAHELARVAESLSAQTKLFTLTRATEPRHESSAERRHFAAIRSKMAGLRELSADGV